LISISECHSQLTPRGSSCKYFWFGDISEIVDFEWSGECISNLVSGKGDMLLTFNDGNIVKLTGTFVNGYPSGWIFQEGKPLSGAGYTMSLKFEENRIVEKIYAQTNAKGHETRVECFTNDKGECYKGIISYHDAVYYGEMNDWLRHGKGKLVYRRTGQYNEGVFEDDFPSGFHTKKSKNGTIIEQGYPKSNASYYVLEKGLNREPSNERLEAASNIRFGSVIKYSKYYKTCGRARSPETTFPIEREIFLKVVAVDKDSGMLTCKMIDHRDLNILECMIYKELGDFYINDVEISYGQIFELNKDEIIGDHRFQF